LRKRVQKRRLAHTLTPDDNHQYGAPPAILMSFHVSFSIPCRYDRPGLQPARRAVTSY
jgi:hypothetical protein